jgi:DNA invertase Pin-like site-specific DNA recombinase
MTSRAIIYLRQSKDVEGTGAAVERQLDDCRALCERQGLDVVRVLTDNNTSASAKRGPDSNFAKLLADITAGACDVVVAWAPDRLYRRLDDAADLMEACLRSRVIITTVQAGTDDPTTPAGEFLMTVKAAQARSEARTKGERQRRQQQQAAERGDSPARRAFGYRTVKTKEGLRAELDPAEATVVREAFDMLFRGESLVTITAHLNSTGLPSVRGNRWHRKGARYLLLSPRYSGVRTYKGTTTPGQWPAIITPEEHEQAVAILEDPARKINTNGTARRWIGSGLFRCECGDTVRIGYRSRVHGAVRAYVCRAGCFRRLAEPVDEYVLEVIRERLAREDVAELLAVADAPELTELRAEAEALRRKITRAMNDYADEAIDAATLRTVKDRHTRSLDAVQRKITAAAQTSRLAALAASADPVVAFESLGLGARREVIDSLCVITLLRTVPGRVGLDPATVRIDWRS